jgi:hypothetical protein
MKCTELRVIDVINITPRNILLVTVEIVSGNPTYGMLFSASGLKGTWKHIGYPHVSFESDANPEQERNFIVLQPVDTTEQLSSGSHLIEIST